MGVPVGIKDIIAVDGMPTTNGSLLDTAHITGPEGAMVQREVLEGWELPGPGPVLMRDGQPTDSAFNFPYSEAQLAETARMLGG